MSRRIRSLTVVTMMAWVVIPPRSAPAQVPADTGLSDARIVELIGSVVINRYSFLAARAAVDTTTNPMDLQLPEDGPVELWQQFREHLVSMMRLRPRTDADHGSHQLYVRNVQVSQDTLIADISTGGARNCRPGWYEDRVVHRVTWTRRSPNVWFVISDKPLSWSESFGRCPGDRPTRSGGEGPG